MWTFLETNISFIIFIIILFFNFHYNNISVKLKKIDDPRLSDITSFLDKNNTKIIVGIRDRTQTIFTVKEYQKENWYIIVIDKRLFELGNSYIESEYLCYLTKLMNYDKYVKINAQIFEAKDECPDIHEQIKRIFDYTHDMEEFNYNPLLVQSIYLNKFSNNLLLKSSPLKHIFNNSKDKDAMNKYYNYELTQI